MAKLTFVLGDGEEIVVPLAEHMMLGRREDNDVVVDDDRVSKRQAELVRNADGSSQLFDASSTAGTFVNGERVRSRTIRHGDRLAFGPLTAVLDLEGNGANGSTSALAPAGNDTQALTSESPVKAGRIGTRRRERGGRRDFHAEKQATLPPRSRWPDNRPHSGRHLRSLNWSTSWPNCVPTSPKRSASAANCASRRTWPTRNSKTSRRPSTA